jgi:cytochrome P450
MSEPDRVTDDHVDAEVSSFFDPSVLDDPFDTYAAMHEQCPVHRLPENGLYMIAGYEDVRETLTDPATFSSRGASHNARGAEALATMGAIIAERGWLMPPVLQSADPPDHTEHRKLLGRVFTPKRVAALTPRIDELTNDLLDRIIERGTMEFVSDFAIPLPGIFICEQYGLPASEYPTFRRWAEATVAPVQRELTVDEAREVAETVVESQHHLAAEFERRRVEPTDDLISALVHSHDDPDDPADPFTIEELQGLMAQLVAGGFETTTAALTTGMWLLLRYPGQMEKLRADRSLMRNFIEESLRFDSPVAGLWRTTTCPVTMAGTEIPAGSMVMPRYAAANRDPSVFDGPDVFDIERPNASAHLAFGQGPHYCIGAALARAELNSAFTAILDRMDDIRLAEPLDDEPHEFSFFLRPFKRMQLAFTAAAAAG